MNKKIILTAATIGTGVAIPAVTVSVVTAEKKGTITKAELNSYSLKFEIKQNPKYIEDFENNFAFRKTNSLVETTFYDSKKQKINVTELNIKYKINKLTKKNNNHSLEIAYVLYTDEAASDSKTFTINGFISKDKTTNQNQNSEKPKPITADSFANYQVQFNIDPENKQLERFNQLSAWENNSQISKTLVTTEEPAAFTLEMLQLQFLNLRVNTEQKTIAITYTLSKDGITSQAKEATISGFISSDEAHLEKLNSISANFRTNQSSTLVDDYLKLSDWNNSLKTRYTLEPDLQNVNLEVTKVAQEIKANKIVLMITYLLKQISPDSNTLLVSHPKTFNLEGLESAKTINLRKLQNTTVNISLAPSQRHYENFNTLEKWNSLDNQFITFNTQLERNNLQLQIIRIEKGREIDHHFPLVLTYRLLYQVSQEEILTHEAQLQIANFNSEISLIEKNLETTSLTISLQPEAKVYEDFKAAQQWNENQNLNLEAQGNLNLSQINYRFLSVKKLRTAEAQTLTLQLTYEISPKNNTYNLKTTKTLTIRGFKTKNEIALAKLEATEVSYNFNNLAKIYDHFNSAQKINNNLAITKSASGALQLTDFDLNITKVARSAPLANGSFSLVITYQLVSKSDPQIHSQNKTFSVSGFFDKATLDLRKLENSTVNFSIAQSPLIFENFDSVAKWNSNSQINKTLVTTLEPNLIDIKVTSLETEAENAEGFFSLIIYYQLIYYGRSEAPLRANHRFSIANFKRQSTLDQERLAQKIVETEKQLAKASARFSINDQQRIFKHFKLKNNWLNNSKVRQEIINNPQNLAFNLEIVSIATHRYRGAITVNYKLTLFLNEANRSLESSLKSYEVINFVDNDLENEINEQLNNLQRQRLSLTKNHLSALRALYQNLIFDNDQKWTKLYLQKLKYIFANLINRSSLNINEELFFKSNFSIHPYQQISPQSDELDSDITLFFPINTLTYQIRYLDSEGRYQQKTLHKDLTLYLFFYPNNSQGITKAKLDATRVDFQINNLGRVFNDLDEKSDWVNNPNINISFSGPLSETNPELKIISLETDRELNTIKLNYQLEITNSSNQKIKSQRRHFKISNLVDPNYWELIKAKLINLGTNNLLLNTNNFDDILKKLTNEKNSLLSKTAWSQLFRKVLMQILDNLENTNAEKLRNYARVLFNHNISFKFTNRFGTFIDEKQQKRFSIKINYTLKNALIENEQYQFQELENSFWINLAQN